MVTIFSKYIINNNKFVDYNLASNEQKDFPIAANLDKFQCCKDYIRAHQSHVDFKNRFSFVDSNTSTIKYPYLNVDEVVLASLSDLLFDTLPLLH
jgi:hypothetical protein